MISWLPQKPYCRKGRYECNIDKLIWSDRLRRSPDCESPQEGILDKHLKTKILSFLHASRYERRKCNEMSLLV